MVEFIEEGCLLYMKKENLIVGSDHAGFWLKNKIIEYLKNEGYNIEDAGTFSKEPVDYPVIAKSVASRVSNNEFSKGILICGTGIGMSITANKIKGIRAVVCSDTTSARFSREHNDANILCFGERIIGECLAKDICTTFLNTDFKQERHLRRVNLIENQCTPD